LGCLAGVLLAATFLAAVPERPVSVAREKAEPAAKAEPLPFTHKVEVYRDKTGDVLAFSLRLEQPFLADEFEKSSYLRLQALDKNAYLLYPTETKFHQKHAEFYGRLRGSGKARLRITYEIVSENLDSSRRIDVRQGDIEVPIPAKEGGPLAIYRDWAQQQNAHFLTLLDLYPQDTFLQYVLLQSPERYGIPSPTLATPQPTDQELEANLYDVFTGSLAIQEALQRHTLRAGGRAGDLNIHISQLHPPELRSPPYAELLAQKQKQGLQPKVHEMATLVPEDQYFLHFQSMAAAGELFDLTTDWGDSLLRLFTISAQDNRVQQKLEDQLCLRRGPLSRLFADGVVAEMAVTGSDFFVVEGTDITLLLRLKQPDLFQKAADNWLAQSKAKYKGLMERDFNYRGHKIAARYTEDRMVSSFVVRHGDYAIYSNSHRAIRKVVDAFTGTGPRLADAPDYRYLCTLLPPADGPRSGYLFVSEAFLKRLVGPAFKISEKRRLQCFNNLVMLNNASLFYRMEYGRSPGSLTDLIENHFVDPKKLVCPHGGAYALDAAQDTCTCSLHNRLKYLTPNAELSVLQVSTQERQEYERYQQHYQAFWQGLFDPIAVRITAAPRVKLEVCVLPFANGSLYQELRAWVADKPQPLGTAAIAPSAVASLVAVRGRKEVAAWLRQVPGIPEALEADPTLTDLGWLGDRLSLHFCDGDALLEVDPTQLRPLDVLGGKTSLEQQAVATVALAALQLPLYIGIDVEDRDKAARLLDQLSRKIFLKKGDFYSLPTKLDVYRLPDYKEHPIYVLSYQLYAVKVRLHVAVVGSQLVAATKPETLREVIDAAGNKEAGKPAEAHLLLRLNHRGLKRLTNAVQLYWEEKSRLACHHNIMPLYTLIKLYDLPMDEVHRLSEAKYGVTYLCPDHGVYAYDGKADQVVCSVHGNRQHSRQKPAAAQDSSFSRFVERVDQVEVRLRFQDDGLIATVEIARAEPGRGSDGCEDPRRTWTRWWHTAGYLLAPHGISGWMMDPAPRERAAMRALGPGGRARGDRAPQELTQEIHGGAALWPAVPPHRHPHRPRLRARPGPADSPHLAPGSCLPRPAHIEANDLRHGNFYSAPMCSPFPATEQSARYPPAPASCRPGPGCCHAGRCGGWAWTTASGAGTLRSTSHRMT
jgi:hypothetical protein